MTTPGSSIVVDVHISGVAVGGDGVGREPSGRVVFVEGALPGEVVSAQVVDERRDHARAVVLGVDDPAPSRVDPPCPFVAAGCGGCGWQHVEMAAQRSLKLEMVTDALRRLGGVPTPVVVGGPPQAGTGYRTTLRGVADEDGRVALRRQRSHDLVAVPGCLVAHPLVVEVLADGRFPPGAEVTVRAGGRTGERLVIVDLPKSGPGGTTPADVGQGHQRTGDAGTGVAGTSVVGTGVAGTGEVGTGDAGSGGAAAGDGNAGEAGAAGPGAIVVPEGVRVVTGAELAAGKRAWFHEEVAGVRLRVSARSFFQAGPEGAELLIAAVDEALGEVPEGARFADLYGGVGLFAATVGRRAHIELVEASASSAADARINLRGLDGRAVRSDVARWRTRRMDVVVADPPRVGLGRVGVRAVSATRARRLALVSCDAGALGRDARLLRGAGYELESSTMVDMFPHTPHVEVVSRFTRRRGQG